MRATVTAIMLLTLMVPVNGQEGGDTRARRQPEAGGYASWLHMALFEKPSDPWLNTAMLHNRLNFKADAGSRITFALELRNRFITGDMVRLDPGYAEQIAHDIGLLDLSWNIFSAGSSMLNIMADRAWVEYRAGKLEVRLGRQRINWSQALIWNPNDIFNTYSLFDFDYVERPGSDAVRLTYHTGAASALEAAVKADADRHITAALLGRFTVMSSDLQFFAGVAESEYLTAGTGWSATVGSYSVRGEATLFAPLKHTDDEQTTIIVTTGADRAFSDKVTATLQLLYSNNPATPDSFAGLYERALTARQTAFSRFSAAGELSYSPTPLISTSLTAAWFPDLDGFYAGPSFGFSLAEAVDFTLLWQRFRGTFAGENLRINLGFLRIRYSF